MVSFSGDVPIMHISPGLVNDVNAFHYNNYAALLRFRALVTPGIELRKRLEIIESADDSISSV